MACLAGTSGLLGRSAGMASTLSAVQSPYERVAHTGPRVRLVGPRCSERGAPGPLGFGLLRPTVTSRIRMANAPCSTILARHLMLYGTIVERCPMAHLEASGSNTSKVVSAASCRNPSARGGDGSCHRGARGNGLGCYVAAEPCWQLLGCAARDLRCWSSSMPCLAH